MTSVTMSPVTCVDDATVGTITWSNPDYAKVSDTNYAIVNFNYHDGGYEKYIQIVKSDGSIGTTNKSTGAWLGNPAGESYVSYGSSTDKWGETWSYADINNSNFGIVYSIQDGYNSNISHYLKATNFGFSIPTGATIDGVLVEIERLESNLGPVGGCLDEINHIRITVYYTASAAVVGPFPTFFRS